MRRSNNNNNSESVHARQTISNKTTLFCVGRHNSAWVNDDGERTFDVERA